ncbi:GPI-anchored serine rich tenascin-like glycoprotein [Achlya hypogyna]|uniref:GPI-anchored serine rich tenascin-like glycoprotein n=1 Tax=Achlya hypogyna TaxID=1202772 RepID=A0A1V9ZUU6_ACHHY|nr:GPI-anchored serine rich tenascin-like glycoprotein [Achlya hypogyna]
MLKLWIIACVAFVSQGQQLQGRCSSNDDCATNAACVTVETGRQAFSKCTASRPLCGGVTFGHCPSQDSEIGPLQCVFKATDKIRNINCCPSTSGEYLVPAPDGSVMLSDSSITSTVTTTTTTTTSTKNNATAAPTVASNSTASRRLQTASSACLNCYKSPANNKTIAGTFECVLQSMCKSSAAFPAVCNVGTSCATGTNQICNGHGTCSPTDSDAPEALYRCLCDVGFGGRFCDKVISNNCVADCGVGGACVDGQCACNKGYTGDQCYNCTSDTACNSANLGAVRRIGGCSSIAGGTCNLLTNKCECNSGFGGNFCQTTGVTTTTSNTCLLTGTARPNCGTKGEHRHANVAARWRRHLRQQCVLLHWAMPGGLVHQVQATRYAKHVWEGVKETLGCTDCVGSFAATTGPSVVWPALTMAAMARMWF